MKKPCWCRGRPAASAGTPAGSDAGTAPSPRSARPRRPDASTTRSASSELIVQTEYTIVPPGRTRAAAACSSSSWSSGSGCERQRRSGPAAINAEPRARRVDERSIEVAQLRGERTAVCVDDTDIRGAETVDVLLELAGTRLVRLDRGHRACEHRRLATGSGAQVEGAFALLRADDEAGKLRASTLRPDFSFLQGFLVDARDLVRAGDVGPLSVRDRSPDMPDHRRRRLVLRPHQRQRRFLAEVAPPDVPHPVRVGVLERPLRQLRQQPVDPVSDPAEYGVRERDGALEPRPADELHRFVHRRVPGHTAEETEAGRRQAGAPRAREHRASGRAACRASRSRGRVSAPAEPSRRRAAAPVTGRGRSFSEAVRSARSA